MTFLLRLAIAISSLLIIATSVVRADPPFANYVFPAGGPRGAALDVTVGGCNLNRQCSWEFDGRGIDVKSQLQRAPQTVWFEGPRLSLSDSQRKEDYPKDFAGHVVIADEAPLGVHRWRVWTSQGVTSAMKFVVGELPEVVEAEISGKPIPVALTLPVTVNGRIFPREDVDIWTFAAAAGESITCEVNAARLGYPLIARVEVLDPAGRRVAEATNNLGADARVGFEASESGTYQVRIHDVRYDGSQSHVYRLTITQRPYVEAIYPLGGRIGTATPFELIGQRVPTTPHTMLLEAVATPTRRPLSVGNSFPVAAEFTNPVLVDIDHLPEYLEPDSASPTTQSSVGLPAVLNGRIRRPGEIDEWRFDGQQGDAWHLDVMAARLDTPLDSVLTIVGPEGRELLRADDIGPGETDSQAVFTVPADGVYTIRVADRFASRGGDRFAYRLRVTPPPAPDFELQLAADAVTVNRGAEATLKVSARRFGGFEGEIKIECNDLPPGVAAEPAVIEPGSSEIDWTLRAEDSAKIQLTHSRVQGRAEIQGEEIVRHASFPTPRGEPPVDSVALLVALPTPFQYTGRTSIEYIPCGSTLNWHFQIDRGGFDGPIDIELADRQFRHLMGLSAPRITIPEGVTDFEYPVRVAPWALQGRTGRAVISASATVQDPDGTQHVVSFSTHADDEQVVVLASPPLLTIDTPRKTIIARRGATTALPIQIRRSSRLNDVPVRVELALPKHVRGVAAQPLEVTPATADCELVLRFDQQQLGPWNAPLIVRASTESQADPVIAELSLTVSDE